MLNFTSSWQVFVLLLQDLQVQIAKQVSFALGKSEIHTVSLTNLNSFINVLLNEKYTFYIVKFE